MDHPEELPMGLQRTRRIQLAVTYLTGNRVRYFQVDWDLGGWKIDSDSQCIVIGKGQPRIMIPLSNVEHFVIEEVWVEK